MKDFTFGAIGVLVMVAAGALVVWTASFVINGVGSWWYSITYVSPEEQARREAAYAEQEEAWAKDPRNPKVAGQKCLDLGGVPDYSAWDGDVKACNKPGGGNIDIKQSVEVRQ